MAWSLAALVEAKVSLKREQWVTHSYILETRGSAATTAQHTENNL